MHQACQPRRPWATRRHPSRSSPPHTTRAAAADTLAAVAARLAPHTPTYAPRAAAATAPHSVPHAPRAAAAAALAAAAVCPAPRPPPCTPRSAATTAAAASATLSAPPRTPRAAVATASSAAARSRSPAVATAAACLTPHAPTRTLQAAAASLSPGAAAECLAPPAPPCAPRARGGSDGSGGSGGMPGTVLADTPPSSLFRSEPSRAGRLRASRANTDAAPHWRGDGGRGPPAAQASRPACTAPSGAPVATPTPGGGGPFRTEPFEGGGRPRPRAKPEVTPLRRDISPA